MRKKNNLDYLIIIIVLITALTVVGCRYAEMATRYSDLIYEVKEYTNYMVSNGDTLWHIAESIKSPNQDTRIIINHILKLNAVENSDHIQRGRELVLPIYWEYVKHLERRK